MESQLNFEYLCRVCAANTKGKNSVAECVYILKTTGLKEKILKYLSITIVDNDFLPKVLCKTCFRQVEATASLSNIAKHTQKLFEDFVSASKQPVDVTPNENEGDVDDDIDVPLVIDEKTPDKELDETNNKRPIIDLLVESRSNNCSEITITPVKSNSPPQQNCRNEVIVNVSINDPLTQKKIMNAPKRRESLPNELRYTPKSIAQRSLANFTATSSHSKEATSEDGQSLMSSKKNTAAGVINFLQYQANLKNSLPGNSTPPIAVIPTNANNTSVELVPAKPILGAQKRKNSKPSSVLRTNGQVSLLKKSQKLAAENAQLQQTQQLQQQFATLQQAQQLAKATSLPISTRIDLLAAAEAQEQPLPERLIIASTKNQKQKQMQQNKVLQNQQHPSSKSPSSSSTPLEVALNQAMPSLTPVTNSSVPSDILLGKVIKDVDLLKLILKALKWPVDCNNIDAQMNRLKNSKFSAVMSDSNLLQDTDLTQLLGPYLAPVLLAAQQIAAAQQMAAAAAAKQTVPIIPYKLPPETSVQLVPASPTEERSSPKATPSPPPLVTTQYKPQVQRKRKSGTIIDGTAHQRSSYPINIDISAMLKEPMSNLDATGEQLILLDKEIQQVKNRGSQRKKRFNNTTPTQQPCIVETPIVANTVDIDFDLDDDIVLMEPDQATLIPESTNVIPTPAPTPLPSASETIIMKNIEISKNPVNDLIINNPAITAFTLPKEPTKPIITRPIIKRRRTAINRNKEESQKEIKDASVATKAVVPASSSTAKETTIEIKIPEIEKQASSLLNSLETTITPEEQVKTEATTPVPEIQDEVSNTTDKNLAPTGSKSSRSTPTLGITTEPNSKTRKTSKSALEKQLLEAVGLQKHASSANSDTSEVSLVDGLSTRESVQQIRAVLKRSLKEAQEQRKRNKVESIKQVADSTTKTPKDSQDNEDSSEVDEINLKSETDKAKKPPSEHMEQTENAPKTPETKIKTELNKPVAGNGRRGRRKDISYLDVEEGNAKSSDEIKDENKVEKESTCQEETSTAEEVKIDSTPKRRGRKRKDEQVSNNKSEEAICIKKEANSKDEEELNEPEKEFTPSRPTRASKSLTRIEKGSEKVVIPKRRSILTRSRNRN